MTVPLRFAYPNGTVAFRDHNGELHRDVGPALTSPEGNESWYRHGLLHRVDGPAVTFPDGHQAWYLHGELHRVGGPAVVNASGSRSWHHHGELHRLDGPARTYPDGTAEWWINGKRRADIETLVHTYETVVRHVSDDGTTRFLNRFGERHRFDGPAEIWSDGTEVWYLHGQRHRTDGPAVRLADGRTEWWTAGHRRHDIEGTIEELEQDLTDD